MAYFEVTGAEGLKFFRCDPLGMTLSTKGCASRHEAALLAKGEECERLSACLRCEIGSLHAGKEYIAHSVIYGAKICPACRRGGYRMIGNRTCVGCYNRRREMAANKNARGHVPTFMLENRPLRAVSIRVISDSTVAVAKFGGVVDMLEAIVQTLRTVRAQIGFGFSSTWEPRQLSLF